VREDEDLDALGFVRRFGESSVSFPSMARVAVQPWIEALDPAEITGARIAISVARRGVVEARELLDDARLGAEPTFHVTRVAEMFEEAADRSGQARWGGVTAIRGVRGGPEGLRHGPAALPGRDGR